MRSHLTRHAPHHKSAPALASHSEVKDVVGRSRVDAEDTDVDRDSDDGHQPVRSEIDALSAEGDDDAKAAGGVILKAKSNKAHRARGASNSLRLRQMQLLEMATKMAGKFDFSSSY